MDTDDLTEMAWSIITRAAHISDTLKTELGAMAGRFKSEDEWIRGVRAHLEKISEDPAEHVDYWNLESEEGLTADMIRSCVTDMRSRADEILATPINRRGPGEW